MIILLYLFSLTNLCFVVFPRAVLKGKAKLFPWYWPTGRIVCSQPGYAVLLRMQYWGPPGHVRWCWDHAVPEPRQACMSLTAELYLVSPSQTCDKHFFYPRTWHSRNFLFACPFTTFWLIHSGPQWSCLRLCCKIIGPCLPPPVAQTLYLTTYWELAAPSSLGYFPCQQSPSLWNCSSLVSWLRTTCSVFSYNFLSLWLSWGRSVTVAIDIFPRDPHPLHCLLWL